MMIILQMDIHQTKIYQERTTFVPQIIKGNNLYQFVITRFDFYSYSDFFY